MRPLRKLTASGLAALIAAGLVGCGVPGDESAEAGVLPTVVIVDSSGSMARDDAPGPRIEAARAAVGTLVDSLPDDAELGMIAYGANTTEEEGPASCADVTVPVALGALDRVAAKAAAAELSPGGWTPIGTALERAASMLPGETGAQIVLVSDGESTCEPPPCEVAERLTRQNLDLVISAIGFRTASDELECIARIGRGAFVTADNAEQLGARLRAVHDVDTVEGAMTGRMHHGIEIGADVDAIRAAFGDFPAEGHSSDGYEIIDWRDCDWWFSDGVLALVAPRDGGRTIDGVGPGSTVADLVRYYDQPLAWSTSADGTDTADFLADEDTGSLWRVAATGRDGSAIVRSIALAAAPRNELMELKAADGARRPYDVDFREVSAPPRYDRVQVFPRSRGFVNSNAHGQWDQNLVGCWRRDEATALCTTSVSRAELFEVPAEYAPVDPDEMPEGDIPLAAVLEDGTVCDALTYAQRTVDYSSRLMSAFHCPDGDELWHDISEPLAQFSTLKGPRPAGAATLGVDGYVVAVDTEAS